MSLYMAPCVQDTADLKHRQQTALAAQLHSDLHALSPVNTRDALRQAGTTGVYGQPGNDHLCSGPAQE